MDQAVRGNVIHFMDEGKHLSKSIPEFTEYYKKKMLQLGATRTYFSYGPTYETVDYQRI